jgi:hypothetical protein
MFLAQSNTAVNTATSIGLGIGVMVGVLIALVVLVFYLLTLQKALTRCSPENRAMQPGMVWLQLIPLFNLVWQFFNVINVAKSLGAEFQKRGMGEDPQPGKTLGLVTCILFCCGIIPVLGALCSLAGLVCWIIYWVKIAGYSNKLA